MTSATLERISKTECAFRREGHDEKRIPFNYKDIRALYTWCKDNGIKLKIEGRLLQWISEETTKRKEWPFEVVEYDTELGKALAHRSFQRKGVEFIMEHKNVLVADEPGLGKFCRNGTLVLTPDGYQKIEKLSVNDLVIGSDGLPHKVTGVYPQGKMPIVRFGLTDGTNVMCSWDHLWTVEEMKQVGPQRKRTWVTNTYTTQELKDKGIKTGVEERRRFRLPRIEPVEFTDEPFTDLDPYLYGILLGDGCLSHGANLSTDHAIIDALRPIFDEYGCVPKLYKNKGYSGDYGLNGFTWKIKELGLLGSRAETKCIPRRLMLSRSVDRIALLQGLLDTDGTHVEGRGKATPTIEYGTVSKKLAHQVKFIVESLGGTASIATKMPTYTYQGEDRIGQKFYRMALALPSEIVPFRLKRKLEKWTSRTRFEPYRYIESIEATGKDEEATCISIDSPDHLYAIEHCILTHNTLQAMASVVESGTTGSVLVVAPKTAAYVTWPHELGRWFADVAPYDEWVIFGGKMTKLERIRALKRIIMWDMGKKRTGPRQWVIVSPNYLRFKVKTDRFDNYVYDDDGNKIIRPVREAQPAFLAIDWSAIIVDEAHQTLSGATGNIKKQSAQRQGLGLLSVADNGLRIAISGTPFRGKHENLWGILNWLYPKDFTSYWNWVGENFNMYVDPITNARVVGEVRDEKKFAKSLERIMLRRTKQEVAPELPRKLYGGTPLILRNGKPGPIAVWLDMEGQQRKAYTQMVDSAMADLEGGTLMANGVLAEMIRLKQFANSFGFIGGDDEFFPCFPSNKFDWIVDFLADRGIDGKGPGESKVIIASQFTKHIDLFSDRLNAKLNIPTFVLTGKTNEAKRIQMQREFQRGTLDSGGPCPDVFLLNTKAGGVSLTLDAADDVVIIDSTFNHEDQEQVEDRSHRLSRMHKVNIWNLASTNSIDESILRNSWQMETSIKKILDGERGIDFAKRLLMDAI